MFRKIQTFSGQLSFACAILLVCILGARNEAFAQNVVSEYDVIGGANITDDAIHFRTKRATSNTFLAAHTIDPTQPGYPSGGHNSWMTWLSNQEQHHINVYRNDHSGRRPRPTLTNKSINTIIITKPSKILNDFSSRNTKSNGHYKWSSSTYRVVIYTSNNGKSPRFFKCPDRLYILAGLDSNRRPEHLQAVCDKQQQRGNPRSCYPTSRCKRIR